MPPVEFEDLGSSLSRLPGLIEAIPDILRNPAANPLQAAILLGIGLIAVLIMLLSVFLFVMRPSREEQELFYGQQHLSEEEQAQAKAAARVDRGRSWLTVTSIILVVGTVVWVAAGVTTSSPEVCASCHPDTSHTAARQEDPHVGVACVYCHEGGGTLARVTVNVATRIEHVVRVQVGTRGTAAYGRPVASDKCYSCHETQISTTLLDTQLGVRVSHKEPLAAGAQCVDCHALRFGTVTAATIGMSACLRCHDGEQAKAECSECHVGDPSQAIRPSVGPHEMAAVQVRNPQCGGCHKDMTSCDACHGIRMPHSDGFKAFQHAREAAITIWDNNVSMCQKCHYAGHRECQRSGCHIGTFPSHPSPVWRDLHGITSWANSATTCGCHGWNPNERAGMNFCQVCHLTKPEGARP